MKVKLKDVCTFFSGTGFPTQYQGKEDGQYPFYKVSDIANNATSGKIYLESCNNYINDDVLGKIKGCVVPRNTVVFAKIGEALKLNRRAITSCDCLIDNNAMGIAPQADFLRIQYFYLFMKNLKMQLLAESTTVPSVRKTKLENYEIIVPSLINQEEIENKIFSVLNIIEKRRQQLKLLDNLIKARFVEMFGDVKYGSERWGGKPFKDITINLDSKRKPVKDADRKSMQGIYPYYGATGIVDYINDYRQDGDFLLISEDGKALELRSKPIAFLASGKIWVNNHAHVQQCTDECNMIYLMYHINFMDISIWVTGIDQKKLNRANLDTIPIALPPIELQEQFADFVHQVDKSKLLSLIKLLEQLITYLYNVFIIYRQDKGEEVEDHE